LWDVQFAVAINSLMHKDEPEISPSCAAYFSMEICLAQELPTYSGGLGVLAGDTLRSAADLGVPMIGVTLLHRKGYFRQELDVAGNQLESPVKWNPERFLELMPQRVSVEIEGRTVHIAAWRYKISGNSGAVVPVYLLDTSLPENSEWDRGLTDTLYGGDNRYRLCQETILGIGGAELVNVLAESGVLPGGSGSGSQGARFRIVHHVNEGHAALLTLRLLERVLESDREPTDSPGGDDDWDGDVTDAAMDAVRAQVVFTTHTPVPAGHDRFPVDLVTGVLGDTRARMLGKVVNNGGYELNMTALALRLSRYVNAVSMRHGDVSREMFPDRQIDAITNGVHAGTWITEPFGRVFDNYLPRWRGDNRYLRQALGIPLEEISAAHTTCKKALVDEIGERTGKKIDAAKFTIGFARRATPYKRADLIFSDLTRLTAIAKKHGPIQLVFAGKAHPNDEPGKELIRRIFRAAGMINGASGVSVVYLEGYDMRLGGLLTSGVDLWLNNPMRPLEASGTSGMKAAMNGVPSLSVLDGWWIEGHIEGATGWSIGDDAATDADPSADVHELYYKLDRVIMPLFYGAPREWAKVMRNSIALNGSYFNTQRMLLQYLHNAYAMDHRNGRFDQRAPLAELRNTI
jgi:glycogen phosphorylase